MAKASEIPELDCSSNALDCARKVLRLRFDEIAGFREAALDFSGIRGVHDMRVATRRLRSAMRDFALLMPKRPPKSLRKDLKDLADALGAVRDQDVAIVALEELRADAAAAADDDEESGAVIGKGIEKLLRERRGLREVFRLNLAEALTPERLAALREKFTAAIDKAMHRKRNDRQTRSFIEAGREIIVGSWRDFYDLGAASIYAPFQIEELHETRIAAKRLRYAIELFVANWGEPLAPFAAQIAEMQSFLGDVHDSDIWIEDLGERLQDGRRIGAGNEADYRAAAWLLSEFVKRRTKAYRSALKLWSDWETKDFSGELQATTAR